jgi:hypothetical protein
MESGMERCNSMSIRICETCSLRLCMLHWLWSSFIAGINPLLKSKSQCTESELICSCISLCTHHTEKRFKWSLYGTYFTLCYVMYQFPVRRGVVMKTDKFGFILMCLTKYHSMMTYPILNQAPRQEYIWGSKGIASRIIILDTRWTWSASGYGRFNHGKKRLSGPQSRYGSSREENKSLPAPARNRTLEIRKR